MVARCYVGGGKWSCDCDCGEKDVRVRLGNLQNGQEACGCIRQEVAKQKAIKSQPLATAALVTHHMSKTPEMYAYRGAVARCTDPKNRMYYQYGALGVEVRVTFEEFFAELGARPVGKTKNGRSLYSLNRFPDPAGHYEKGNMRWATVDEQAQNKRPRPDKLAIQKLAIEMFGSRYTRKVQLPIP